MRIFNIWADIRIHSKYLKEIELWFFCQFMTECVTRGIITDYNPDSNYVNEVMRLSEKTFELQGSPDVTLLPIG